MITTQQVDRPPRPRRRDLARGASVGRWLAGAAIGCWLAALANCTPYGGQVTRVVDGKTQEGRYVPQPAYADYSLGAYLEASGKFDQAESAYVRALADDPESPEMWTRLGALRCRRAPSSGLPAFERALSLAPEYEPTWRARARCLLADGKVTQALRSAQRAFRLDPNQEQATLLISEIFARQGRTADARLWLNAWVTRYPGAFEVWSALLALAEHSGSAADRARAKAVLDGHSRPQRERPLHPRPRGNPGAANQSPRDDLDAALDLDDLAAAQRASVKLGLPAVEVAVRAYLRGNRALARDQSTLLLEADPSNSDARVILLLLGDPAAAQSLEAAPDPLSPAVRRLLAAALERAAP